jgi:hypothetical protein
MGTLLGVFASGIVLLPTLLLAALITYAAARGSRNKYVASTSTVLETFLINPSPSEGPAIYISGRYKGLIAWLLTNLGMETRIELTVTSKYLSLRQASLAGMKIDYIPLSRIRATICGYQQSLLAFFFAVFFSLNGLWMLLGALPLLVHGISENTEYGWQTTDKDTSVVLFVAFCWLLGAGAAMVAYHLSKRAALGVRAIGEGAVGVVFKRSLIEGQVIDLEMAEKGTALLNRLVQAAADNVPLDQVPALPPPQSPEKGHRVFRARMAIAGYAALFIVATALAWYGNGVELKVNAMPTGSSVWLDDQFSGVTNDNGTLAIPHVLRQGHDIRI